MNSFVNNTKNKTINKHSTIFQNYKFLFSFSLKEQYNRKCYYFLALISCILVTLVALISNSILNKGPLLFLLIAEINSGEKDIEIESKYLKLKTTDIEKHIHYYSFLNYTKFVDNSNYYNKSIEQISSPRIEKLGKVTNVNNYDLLNVINRKNISNNSTYSLLNNLNSNFTDIDIYFIDPLKEKIMGLGRNSYISESSLDSESKCIISKYISDKLNLGRKSYIKIKFNSEEFIKNYIVGNYSSIIDINNNDISVNNNNKINNLLDQINDFKLKYDIMFYCQITDIFDDSMGKFNRNVDSFVILNINYAQNIYFNKFNYNKSILKYFPNIYSNIKDFFNKHNVLFKDFSNKIIINLPEEVRLQEYLVSDYDTLQKNIVDFSKNLNIISSSYKIKYPILDEIKPLNLGAIFLNLILNIVILVLFGLSIILIYSLILVTTETSTFELGILRLIGLNKTSIVTIIIIQCLSYSIPSFIIAFIFHYVILHFASSAISFILETNIDFKASIGTIFYSLVLCLISPIVGSIYPIYNLLNKNINNSINNSIKKTSGVKIEIISLIKREQFTLISFGILSVIYGVCIYYFLPLSLISLNFGLLLAIFMWILIGMIIGCVLIASNIELYIQKIINLIFLFWMKNYIRQIILKNLIGHRLRNKNSSLMFSLSVGVFIMILVAVKIEFNSVKLNYRKKIGADIKFGSFGDYYPTPKRLNYTIQLLLDQNLIKDFTYVSPRINNICCDINVSNIGKSFFKNLNLIGISPNFYDISDNAFLSVYDNSLDITLNSRDNNMLLNNYYNKFFNTTTNKYFTNYASNFKYENNKLISPSESLYLIQNKGKLGTTNYLNDNIGLNIYNEFFIKFNKINSYFQILTKPAYILSSSPSYEMSNLNNIKIKRFSMISYPMYINLLNKIILYMYDNIYSLNSINQKNLNFVSLNYEYTPIEDIYFTLVNDDNESIDKIINIFKSESNLNLIYRTDLKAQNSLNSRKNFILNIFYGSSIIILIFCLFNQSTTMIINLHEQKKEISIFMSLGLKKSQIEFIYIAESIILIFSSSIVGLIIGTIISWTILIQRILFTNLPLQFEFPYLEMLVLLIISVFGGYITTYFSIKNITNKQISYLLKN